MMLTSQDSPRDSAKGDESGKAMEDGMFIPNPHIVHSPLVVAASLNHNPLLLQSTRTFVSVKNIIKHDAFNFFDR